MEAQQLGEDPPPVTHHVLIEDNSELLQVWSHTEEVTPELLREDLLMQKIHLQWLNEDFQDDASDTKQLSDMQPKMHQHEGEITSEIVNGN